MTKKMVSLDELSRYDGNIKDFISNQAVTLCKIHITSDVSSTDSAGNRAAFKAALDCHNDNKPYLLYGDYTNMPFIAYINTFPSSSFLSMKAISSPILDDTVNSDTYGARYYFEKRLSFSVTVNSNNEVTKVELSSLTTNVLSSLTFGNNKIATIDNTSAFTPTGNYNLVHKKYVDDSIPDLFSFLSINQYSSSSTYSVDDYVCYNKSIYKCNTAISTAEEFDSSKWTQKTALEYLKDALNIPSTGVNESSSSDIDDLFNNEEVSE